LHFPPFHLQQLYGLHFFLLRLIQLVAFVGFGLGMNGEVVGITDGFEDDFCVGFSDGDIDGECEGFPVIMIDG